MKISDFIPNPINQIKGTTTALLGKSENGQSLPYVQQVMKNFGHAAFGDKVAGKVDNSIGFNPQPNVGAADLARYNTLNTEGGTGAGQMQGIAPMFLDFMNLIAKKKGGV